MNQVEDDMIMPKTRLFQVYVRGGILENSEYQQGQKGEVKFYATHSPANDGDTPIAREDTIAVAAGRKRKLFQPQTKDQEETLNGEELSLHFMLDRLCGKHFSLYSSVIVWVVHFLIYFVIVAPIIIPSFNNYRR